MPANLKALRPGRVGAVGVLQSLRSGHYLRLTHTPTGNMWTLSDERIVKAKDADVVIAHEQVVRVVMAFSLTVWRKLSASRPKRR